MNRNMNMTILLRGYLTHPLKQISVYSKNGKECIMGVITLAVKPMTTSEKTEFLPITVFNNTYHLLEQYTEVGSQILVSCILHNNVYQHKEDGKKIYKGLQLIADDVQFLSSPQKKNREKG